MTDQPLHRLTCFQRIINAAALIYLLLIIAYALCRFTIGDRVWFISLLNTFALAVFVPLPIFFVLALIARSRRALLYLLPVIIWIGLWLGPRFLPKNHAPNPNTPTLRIMTNNMWHVNQSPELVPQEVHTQNPDVTFLQEAEIVDSQSTVVDTLNAAYPYYSRLDDDTRSYMYAAANLTYSRFPFVISEKIDPNIPEMPAIYRNVIEWNGQRIALYNIHLLSPGGANRLWRIRTNYFVRYAFDFYDKVRNTQIDALLAYLATEPYPYIVAGDFNTSDFSMSYSHLAANLHDSFSEAGIGLGSTWPMARALLLPTYIPPLIRIDYIWHSAGLEAVNAWSGDFTGSDHLPMFADLVLSS